MTAKRRRKPPHQLAAAQPLFRLTVEGFSLERTEVGYAGINQAATAFANAILAGDVEEAELCSLDESGEPVTRLARYSNDGL